jgi:hypothetical protein
MKRTMVSLAVMTSGLLGFSTEPASAQLSVGVHLSWHWSEGGWHSDRVLPRGDMYRAPAPLLGYGAPARSVRIPPGHLPPPGTCRLWYVGRPPGTNHHPRRAPGSFADTGSSQA